MTVLSSHPQRVQLHDELHQRPGMPVHAPARVSSLTLFGAGGAHYREFFNTVLRAVGQLPLAATVSHWQQRFSDFELRWSLHNEFARLTVVQTVKCDDFSTTALACLPPTIWSQLPGEVMCAIHALVLVADGEPESLTTVSQRWFSGNALLGSRMAHGKLIVLSDLKRHDDDLIESGATRLCVFNSGAGKHLIGRVLHDFFEMESYRLMGLLSFPLAKKYLPVVTQMENQLQAITKAIADGEDPELTQQHLHQVAEALEDAIASSHFRFSASRAYAEMMARRLKNLHEEAFEGFASFGEFMERRISPAFATVESVRNRLQELSEHLQRTSSLLRTRIEMNLLKQNRQLLEALNQRATQQLRLQQTVEGLSVAVIGYYAVSLWHYFAEGLAHAGIKVDPDITTAAAIPLVLGVLMWRITRLRKHFHDERSTR